jgi:hypothetical protein
VLSGEATNTNFIIFGLTLGKHANHYTIDAVLVDEDKNKCFFELKLAELFQLNILYLMLKIIF